MKSHELVIIFKREKRIRNVENAVMQRRVYIIVYVLLFMILINKRVLINGISVKFHAI